MKATGEHLLGSRRIHREENFHVEKNRDGSRAGSHLFHMWHLGGCVLVLMVVK